MVSTVEPPSAGETAVPSKADLSTEGGAGRRHVVEEAVVLVVHQEQHGPGPDLRIGGQGLDHARRVVGALGGAGRARMLGSPWRARRSRRPGAGRRSARPRAGRPARGCSSPGRPGGDRRRAGRRELSRKLLKPAGRLSLKLSAMSW